MLFEIYTIMYVIFLGYMWNYIFPWAKKMGGEEQELPYTVLYYLKC